MRRRLAEAVAEPAPASPEGEGRAVPLEELLGFQLRRAHNLFALHWQLGFRDSAVPVTPVQGGMLVVIDANPGLTQAECARLMRVEEPTLQRSIDRLEALGLVEKARIAGDRRRYALHLTGAGRAALDEVRGFVPAREGDLLGALDAGERRQLLELLRRVNRHGEAVIRAMGKGGTARGAAAEGGETG